MNKLFIMAPLAFAVRKIDAEDPQQIFILRIAYGVVQTICIIIVAYTFIKTSSMSGKGGTIYVAPPAQPFADPNAKKKYTEVNFGTHVYTTARSLLGSTLFGVVLTLGLHFYKGITTGLAMQVVMAPMNLIENPVVKALLLGKGIRPEDKIFEEKTGDELTDDDEIVDENGNPVVRSGTVTEVKPAETPFEEILLDTWAAGKKADIVALMSEITEKNCNFRTEKTGWTPMMVLAGLNAKGTASAIRQLKELGGNPAITDGDGWTALHWASFHGSLDAAKELSKDASLLSVKDKEGVVPADMAKAEGHDEIAKFLETAAESSETNDDDANGLRKRK